LPQAGHVRNGYACAFCLAGHKNKVVKTSPLVTERSIAIDHIDEELILLGISEVGIEIMRHKNKLIYGSQFHPEELKDGDDGHTILKNFLKMV
jgi:anthranilate/para-aminobenzoate synthase component II